MMTLQEEAGEIHTLNCVVSSATATCLGFLLAEPNQKPEGRKHFHGIHAGKPVSP